MARLGLFLCVGGGEDPALEFSCELGDALELVGDVFAYLLEEGLFGLVALEHEHVAVLVVGLEAGVVPVLNEVVGEVEHCFPLQMHAHVVPRQSRCVPRNPVPPELPHILYVLVSRVVVLDAGVVIGVVVVDEMEGVVEAAEAQVEPAQERLGLINDN